MTDRFYKNFDIVNSQYFKQPNWTRKDFSDIPGKELIWQQGDRLDIIAYNLYGSSAHWKALALYNEIGDIFSIQPGDRIFLPTKIKDVLDRI